MSEIGDENASRGYQVVQHTPAKAEFVPAIFQHCSQANLNKQCKRIKHAKLIGNSAPKSLNQAGYLSLGFYYYKTVLYTYFSIFIIIRLYISASD